MNIQQFLEEEFKDYGVRISEDEDHFEFESPSPNKILDFANKVLDEVISKILVRGRLKTSTEILEIIESLKLK